MFEQNTILAYKLWHDWVTDDSISGMIKSYKLLGMIGIETIMYKRICEARFFFFLCFCCFSFMFLSGKQRLWV